MNRTCKPIAAGIVNIISGAFFLIGGISILGNINHPAAISWASYIMYSMGQSDTPSLPLVTMITAILAIALIIPGLVSIFGGIYAIKRQVWGLALAGSIMTFLCTLLLGIPAIALTALSKKEFT